MASQVPPKKNTAFNLGLCLYLNTGALVTNPGTITAKISKDFGDYADVGTVTEEDSTYGQIKLALTATEMNADVVMIYVKDNTSGCVPFTCTIYTAANLMDDIKTDTANNYAILNHADYGNAKLVRSTTPANTLTVDAAHNVGLIRPAGTIVDDAGNSTTVFKTNLTSSEDDYIKDAYVKFTSGANINQVKKISAYNGTSKVITTAAFTDEPAENDTFVIINE